MPTRNIYKLQPCQFCWGKAATCALHHPLPKKMLPFFRTPSLKSSPFILNLTSSPNPPKGYLIPFGLNLLTKVQDSLDLEVSAVIFAFVGGKCWKNSGFLGGIILSSFDQSLTGWGIMMKLGEQRTVKLTLPDAKYHHRKLGEAGTRQHAFSKCMLQASEQHFSGSF